MAANAEVPVVPVTLGATLKMQYDPMEKCTVDGCLHNRYWHDGDEMDENNGKTACTRLDCPCTGGKYPSDVSLE